MSKDEDSSEWRPATAIFGSVLTDLISVLVDLRLNDSGQHWNYTGENGFALLPRRWYTCPTEEHSRSAAWLWIGGRWPSESRVE